MMLLKIRAKPFNIAIILTYTPTNSYPEEKVEEYFEQLQKLIKMCKSNEIIILMGDCNTKVGSSKYKNIVGQHGLGNKNEHGERFIEFCKENQLIICNTFFQHHKRRLYTWKSPGDIYRNQIDYIMISDRHKKDVKQART